MKETDKQSALLAELKESMKDKNSRIFLLLILGIFVIIFFTVSTNFSSPYLWGDEAGQFWISKGLNHESDPFSPEKGIPQVIENNRSYNLDPGGFSILLHFWTFVSNHHVWLRLLPFLFFLGIVLSFIYLSYLWSKDLIIALLTGFIPFLAPKVLFIGFEIRAYSMEALGTVLSIIALERLKNNLTNKQLLLWGALFSLFLTSRYSESIVISFVSLYVFFLIFRSDASLNRKITFAAMYSLPILITLFLIYFFTLRYQSSGSGIKQLAYLRYLNGNPRILLEHLHSLALFFLGLIIPALFLLRRKFPVIVKYEALLMVTFFVNVSFIILSFMGKYPWDLHSIRNISSLMLLVLCFLAATVELLKVLFRNSSIFKYYLVFFSLIAVLYVKRDVFFCRAQYTDAYITFKNMETTKLHRIYVDRWESPCIRYLFEYGALKSKRGTIYPAKFTFEKMGPSCSKIFNNEFKDFYKTQPEMNDLLDYDLLIAPEKALFSTKKDKWQLMKGSENFYVKVPSLR
jgi:hypothetical protein